MFRKSTRVRDHMLKKPVLVTPETDLFEAISLIIKNKISGVTVVDEHHRPVGMLSELDCMRAIIKSSYHAEEIGKHLVKDHMTPNVECVRADDDVFNVASSMLDHKHRRRPVIDDRGHLVGQLTCRQLLKVIKAFDVPGD